MIIAVNTRLNKDTQPEGYEDFLFEMLGQLVNRYPQHQFIFISDRQQERVFSKNVTSVIAGPKTGSNLRLQYWFNYRIPVILRKYKAGVFVSMESICSLRTKVPQCLLLGDTRFLDHSQSLKRSQARFYKRAAPAFLAKAKNLVTVSTYSKLQLADQFKINTNEVAVIYPVIDARFKPMDREEKETVKEYYAEGKAYFLFSGRINEHSNFINLLKAFSFFKKRQKSNMLLLIAGNADESFKKAIKTYKLRNEVKLLEHLPTAELAKITAAAYALVYPVLYADLAMPVLQAMQCAVPVITTDAANLSSVFGKAAIYHNPADPGDLAQKMMLVFKDEDKVNELVKAGNKLIQQHEPVKTADFLMQCILKCVN